jgi:hypothetical protein
MYPCESGNAPREISPWETLHCPWYMDFPKWERPFNQWERDTQKSVIHGVPPKLILNSSKEGSSLDALDSN